MLFNRIKQDLLNHRRNRDTEAVGFLALLIGECERAAGKEPTDEEVIRVIRKSVESIDETLKLRPSDSLIREKEVITTYLPQTLTKEQVVGIVDGLKAQGINTIGPVMSYFKANYTAGTYLPKDVSDAVRGV